MEKEPVILSDDEGKSIFLKIEKNESNHAELDLKEYETETILMARTWDYLKTRSDVQAIEKLDYNVNTIKYKLFQVSHVLMMPQESPARKSLMKIKSLIVRSVRDVLQAEYQKHLVLTRKQAPEKPKLSDKSERLIVGAEEGIFAYPVSTCMRCCNLFERCLCSSRNKEEAE